MHLFNPKNLKLTDKTIMVTGGTGSFGHQFVKNILETLTPRKVILYSRDEDKQWAMATNPFFEKYRKELRFFIGDVRDAVRLEMAMRGVDYVIHAAALKHVPVAEYNPIECIKTNVYGAENVITAAIQAGVKKVIALSTDKAANPVNLYGASKLASDKIFIAGNHLGGKNGCRFSVVRYGNVLGSRGSVIVLFRRLIESGADFLPITDPRMTRFWITIDQGVQFVLSSLETMKGGEIFVPKIPSMSITDLADAFAPEMEKRVVGIRPGEKLHEILVTEDDSRSTFDLGDRYVIAPNFARWDGKFFKSPSGELVPESFRYASDVNEEWLSKSELNNLLEHRKEIEQP